VLKVCIGNTIGYPSFESVSYNSEGGIGSYVAKFGKLMIWLLGVDSDYES
jgi:hypothetical protein